MLSYHLYCPLVTSQGQPVIPIFCNVTDVLTLYKKFENYKSLGIGGFLTEFGALSDSEKSANEILIITGYAEKNFQSWIYWQFKYFQDITTAAKPATTESFYYENGTLQMNKIRALTHPYAYAICGQPISSKFTNTSFDLTWKPGKCEADTEIFINEPLYFADGFSIVFYPDCPQCHLRQIETSYYKVMTPNSLNKKVTLKVVGQI